MTKALDYFDPTRGRGSEPLVEIEKSSAEIQKPLAKTEKPLAAAKTSGNSHSTYTQHEQNALKAAFAHSQCQYLVVSFTSDWRFAPERSQEIVDALMATGKPVSYVNIDAPHGHDSFLFVIPRYMNAIKGFLTAPFITNNYDSKDVLTTGENS